MYARNSKLKIDNGISPPIDLATWTPARLPFAELTRANNQVTNAKSSQWMIAVGAVSVAAITATLLAVDYSGSESEKAAVSLGPEAPATDVHPSIDFGPRPSEETLYSEEPEVNRMGGSSSRVQAPSLPSVFESRRALPASAKEMPSLARAREEPQVRSHPSPGVSPANVRNVTSFLPEASMLTEAGGPTPKPKADSRTAEYLAVQYHRLDAGETANRVPFSPTQQAQAGNLHTKIVGTTPDAQLTQIKGDAEGPNIHSVTTYDLSATGEMVAADQAVTDPVSGEFPVDDVLLLDVELADAAIAPILSTNSAGLVEEIEFIRPTLDGHVISHAANIEGASSSEAPQKVHADEGYARHLATSQASSALNETVLTARAVAPVAELVELVQNRSKVEIAGDSSRPNAEGSSLEVLPGTVATQAQAGGTVGSLPLQISTDALVSVRLADLISMFEDRMDRPLFVWLKSSSSANEYVTFDTLKSAGIDAQYDAGTRQVALSISDDRAP